jgi:hypothetical protein
MPCHAMHPIQDLFLESFSYVLQFDMHFYMHSYVDKKFILAKSGCYMISAIKLVAVLVPGKTRDLLTTTWMSDKSRPVKMKKVT